MEHCYAAWGLLRDPAGPLAWQHHPAPGSPSLGRLSNVGLEDKKPARRADSTHSEQESWKLSDLSQRSLPSSSSSPLSSDKTFPLESYHLPTNHQACNLPGHKDMFWELTKHCLRLLFYLMFTKIIHSYPCCKDQIPSSYI